MSVTITNSETVKKSKPAKLPEGTFRWRWWYKGRTPEGNTANFQGYVVAEDHWKAADNVEKMMREKFPHIKWMQGREIEGKGDNAGVTFGPTIQQLKGRNPKGAA